MAEPASEPVDIPRLCEWMDGQGFERGAIHGWRPLSGGTQNLLFVFEKDGRRFVLRRPPLKPRPGNNDTMRREARVLGALAQTDVPHPRLIAACDSEDVLGAAFYLMEPIDGFNATVGLPALHAANTDIRRRMGFAMVDGAAALARVDYAAVGLTGFGKPDNFLARQVERWGSQLESYRSHARWPGPGGLPGVDSVARFLDSHRPADSRPGILHGDYHLGNVMYRIDGPEVAAIVDWELATIGDPLIDLGWMLATWRGEDEIDLGVLNVDNWDGFPTMKELVSRYAEGSSRDLCQINWYVVLACYKLGIILEGSYARAYSGAASVDVGARLHNTAVRLFERANQRIGLAGQALG